MENLKSAFQDIFARKPMKQDSDVGGLMVPEKSVASPYSSDNPENSASSVENSSNFLFLTPPTHQENTGKEPDHKIRKNLKGRQTKKTKALSELQFNTRILPKTKVSRTSDINSPILFPGQDTFDWDEIDAMETPIMFKQKKKKTRHFLNDSEIQLLLNNDKKAKQEHAKRPLNIKETLKLPKVCNQKLVGMVEDLTPLQKGKSHRKKYGTKVLSIPSIYKAILSPSCEDTIKGSSYINNQCNVVPENKVSRKESTLDLQPNISPYIESLKTNPFKTSTPVDVELESPSQKHVQFLEIKGSSYMSNQCNVVPENNVSRKESTLDLQSNISPYIESLTTTNPFKTSTPVNVELESPSQKHVQFLESRISSIKGRSNRKSMSLGVKKSISLVKSAQLQLQQITKRKYEQNSLNDNLHYSSSRNIVFRRQRKNLCSKSYVRYSSVIGRSGTSLNFSENSFLTCTNDQKQDWKCSVSCASSELEVKHDLSRGKNIGDPSLTLEPRELDEESFQAAKTSDFSFLRSDCDNQSLPSSQENSFPIEKCDKSQGNEPYETEDSFQIDESETTINTLFLSSSESNFLSSEFIEDSVKKVPEAVQTVLFEITSKHVEKINTLSNTSVTSNLTYQNSTSKSSLTESCTELMISCFLDMSVQGPSSKKKSQEILVPPDAWRCVSTDFGLLSDKAQVVIVKLDELISEAALHGPLTARKKVLCLCRQTEPITFSSSPFFRMLKTSKKIGEGSYGEVYSMTKADSSCVAVKIIPIEGNMFVNGEPQLTFKDVLSEIIFSKGKKERKMTNDMGDGTGNEAVF